VHSLLKLDIPRPRYNIVCRGELKCSIEIKKYQQCKGMAANGNYEVNGYGNRTPEAITATA
jgi:hypothetical protein